ncbi:MAG TPA: hypothetical protein VNE21_01580 [Mycobacteriales bacterium]|nr:hypothetical protein [Mycobacteriales bacterium]
MSEVLTMATTESSQLLTFGHGENDVVTDSDEPLRTGRLARLRRWLGTLAVSPAAIWAGVAVTAAGFGLIAITWGQVAATLNVGLQLPYIVSGGFTGIGLVLVGLAWLSIVTKRRDGLERSRQLEELRELLTELRRSWEDEPT